MNDRSVRTLQSNSGDSSQRTIDPEESGMALRWAATEILDAIRAATPGPAQSASVIERCALARVAYARAFGEVFDSMASAGAWRVAQEVLVFADAGAQKRHSSLVKVIQNHSSASAQEWREDLESHRLRVWDRLSSEFERLSFVDGAWQDDSEQFFLIRQIVTDQMQTDLVIEGQLCLVSLGAEVAAEA